MDWDAGILGPVDEFVLTESMWAALTEAQYLRATAPNISRLATQHGAQETQWAFTQWEIRRRATAKFDRAMEMLFTRAGYEMATHQAIGRWRSARFGLDPIVDATAGVGGDAIEVGRNRPVIAVESDPETRAYLGHNLAVHDIQAEIIAGDALEVLDRQRPLQAFADPARRKEGATIRNPDASIPPAQDLAARLRRCELGALKLSPLTSDEFLNSLGGTVEFVSFGGECREALVWFSAKNAVGTDRIRAAHVESGEFLDRCERPAIVAEPDSAIYEADPAAIRAHALGQFGFAQLGDSPGYLTGPAGRVSVWLTEFETLWLGPWREKSVVAELRRCDWQLMAVKKRGVSDDPHAVLKRLAQPGGEPVELLLYPVRNAVRAAIVRRVIVSEP